MHTFSITLRQVPYSHPDFLQLCNELDQFLNLAIGGEDKREKYKKYNHLDTMDYVIIAYDGQHAAGCAALRKYSDTEIEVKRVFVQEPYRGQNIGGRLLAHLIEHAQESGYKRMLLETGAFLSASVRLYQRYGFEQISNYGDYKDMPESLCMGRDISTP
ncbi:MAG: GNAT family N-acetyltransferase [Lachnospiraceae bacterium]|nr:GNAT family N-acetyltransferase [Lachnospiraceae bacterium]